MTQRFKLTIEYDGRPYMGWQRQAHGPSVQQALEEALEALTGVQTSVQGAGRPDSGVHASGQVAHCDIARPFTGFRLRAAINHHLRALGHGDRIAVLRAEPARGDFHARFDAIYRTYRYDIINRHAPLTWQAGLAWRIGRALDVPAMQAAARALVGRHDFTTFRSVHCQAESPVRTLDRLDVVMQGEQVQVFAEARSFLHHQVRSMVGCLALVGQGRWVIADVSKALDARDRAALGLNAPPDGLYFTSVRYAERAPAAGDWTAIAPD